MHFSSQSNLADARLGRYNTLAANGSTQLEGVDVDETFSPVVKPGTIRTVLSLAAFRHWPIHQLDVKNAFLHEVSLWLKQCLRAWFHAVLHRIILGLVCSQIPIVLSLFIYRQGTGTAYLLLYVDDIVLTASSESISVTRDSSGLFLSHKKYAVEILERAHMVNSNPCRTPVDTESKLGVDGDPVCLYMHDPREPHFSALKRIMRYVQGTLDYGLQLFSSSTTDLVAYSDADWAGCPTTRRSTSSYCVFLGNNLLSWSSKCQPTLSRSSAEAEYCGITNAVAETCWLRNLLRELHTPLSSATLVYCDNVMDARNVFDEMRDKDLCSWNTMVSGYAKAGRVDDARTLFDEMVERDNFSWTAIISGMDSDAVVWSALSDMYGKCGSLDEARCIFDKTSDKDVVTWTAMIDRYFKHGKKEEGFLYCLVVVNKYMDIWHALGLTSLLLQRVLLFICIVNVGTLRLRIESLSGYRNPDIASRTFLKSTRNTDGLAYTVDHYACVVDLLSRSGRFSEAEDIINKMPMKPDKFLWASVLAGCRIHGNLDLAKRAAQALFEIEPENAATYVTLSNIYAAAGKWGEVAKVRNMMDVNRVVKKPGRSWTEIKRKVYTFLMGDTSHPRLNEIHELLEELQKRMREEGYVPKTDYVLHDVEDEQKEQNLSYHSEKLAIAFAILATPPGTPIKVFKNLRTCVDCHTAIKYISKLVSRKIIVRDSSRFHCFEGGSCSCKDYW
ncbi:pentatricopeptide repeat-containing protein [Tanacetum coccineum]